MNFKVFISVETRKLIRPKSCMANIFMYIYSRHNLVLRLKQHGNGGNTARVVQVYDERHWRFLFDGNWTKADADVMCKGEDFSGAIEQPYLPVDEKWIQNITSRDYLCHGNESDLTKCKSNKHNYSHISDTKVVGVRCKDEGMKS